MFEAEAQRSVLRSGDWLFASTTLDPPRSRARGEAGDRRTDRCCGSAARRVIWSGSSHSATRTRLCRFPFSTDLPSGPIHMRYMCAWPEALTNRVQSRFVISFAVTRGSTGLRSTQASIGERHGCCGGHGRPYRLFGGKDGPRSGNRATLPICRTEGG